MLELASLAHFRRGKCNRGHRRHPPLLLLASAATSSKPQVYHYIYSFCHTATQKRSYWFSYGQFSIKRRGKNPNNSGFKREWLISGGGEVLQRVRLPADGAPICAKLTPPLLFKEIIIQEIACIASADTVQFLPCLPTGERERSRERGRW